jgi:hypothetical protein
MGIPVSTTHTITGAIVGVGATKGSRAVQWGVAGRIVWACEVFAQVQERRRERHLVRKHPVRGQRLAQELECLEHRRAARRLARVAEVHERLEEVFADSAAHRFGCGLRGRGIAVRDAAGGDGAHRIEKGRERVEDAARQLGQRGGAERAEQPLHKAPRARREPSRRRRALSSLGLDEKGRVARETDEELGCWLLQRWRRGGERNRTVERREHRLFGLETFDRLDRDRRRRGSVSRGGHGLDIDSPHHQVLGARGR